MPSVKRRLDQLQKDKSKIARSNQSIASFFNGSPAKNTISDDVHSDITSTPLRAVIDTTSNKENNPPTPTSSGHSIGYKSDWEISRPWLYSKTFLENGDKVTAMFCHLCQSHNSSTRNGSSTWTKDGYRCLRLDKVTQHEKSDQHQDSIRLETCKQLDIKSALSSSASLCEKEFTAVKCAMKCLHFLIKHNVPHNTVFKDFIDFAKDELKVPDLQYLSSGKNATYTSSTSINEFVDCISDDVEEIVTNKVKESPAYSIMADESTDIAMRKHLIFNVKYVDTNGEVNTEFLKDVQIENGTADTIFNATKDIIENKTGVENLVAFGSDGCNTMIGRKNGVSTKLRELKPNLINIHCHNHRLALAAKDSFESIPLLKDIDALLGHVFKYYHGSAVRSQSLAKMQKLLNESEKTIKNAAHTRWLSHLNAVTSLRDSFEAVIVDLENCTASGKENVRIGSGPSASGLAKKLKTVQAVHVVHFLCDALKPVTQLALTFEKNAIDLSCVHPRLQATLANLKRLKTVDGPNVLKVPKLLERLSITAKEGEMARVKFAELKFIDNLMENISLRLQNSEIIEKMGIFDLSSSDDDGMFGNDEMMDLADHFDIDVDEALSDWDGFKNSVADNKDAIIGPHSVIKTLTSNSARTGNVYNSVYQIASAASVLPISTSDVERMFSDVKRTVTVLRNRLKVETTHKLLMIHQNEKYIDFDSIAERWLKKGNRRIVKPKQSSVSINFQ